MAGLYACPNFGDIIQRTFAVLAPVPVPYTYALARLYPVPMVVMVTLDKLPVVEPESDGVAIAPIPSPSM